MPSPTAPGESPGFTLHNSSFNATFPPAQLIASLEGPARRVLSRPVSKDWDGAGASAIFPLAAFKATAFVRALPNNIPLPEFAPEPDGSVSLDWIQSRGRLFSLSVGTSDRLAYAWLDGADKGHAVARFDGTTVPPLILEGNKAIMNHGNAPLRAA